MATERTAMTPDGDVVFLEVADEQYMTPEGSVIDGGLDAAAAGTSPLVLYTVPGLSVTNP